MDTSLAGVAYRSRSRFVVAAFGVAAVAGVVHGLFSFYWAAGGDWLVATLGSGLVAEFEGRRWLLYLVGAVKVAFAVVPLVWAVHRRPRHRLWRWGCWLGAVVLVVWGGLNTVIGNLVLAGLVRPSGGYDRDAMAGHAWLWDPLFLVWGVALAAGLVATSAGRASGRYAGERPAP